MAQPKTSGQKISRPNVAQPLVTPRQKISWPNVAQPKIIMQKISRPNAVQHDNLLIGQKISWPKKAQPKTKGVGEKLKARFAQKLEIVRTNIAKMDNITEEEILTSTDTPTTPYSSESAEMAEFVIKEIS